MSMSLFNNYRKKKMDVITLFIFSFTFFLSVLSMWVVFYLFLDAPPTVYLLLIPYGIWSGYSAINMVKKWKKQVYTEIANITDPDLVLVVPMNYVRKGITESGIGYIYPANFIFKHRKKADMQLMIPFSDVLRVESGKWLFVGRRIKVYLRDGVVKKFVIERERENEIVECMNKHIAT